MVDLRNYKGGPPPRAHLPALSFGANILGELEKKLWTLFPTVLLPFSYFLSQS